MNQSDSRLLIVLEARNPESTEIPTSSSQRLVAALRDQVLIGDEAKSLSRRFDRLKAYLGSQSRSVTPAVVLVLLISSLMFGLGSALQIDQAERPGFSFSERIGGLFVAQGAADPGAGQDIASTPANTLASYGASFGWTDRFNTVEVQRETASSKVLWPLSTIISMLILTALMLPRSNPTQQELSAD